MMILEEGYSLKRKTLETWSSASSAILAILHLLAPCWVSGAFAQGETNINSNLRPWLILELDVSGYA
jgi:hypothetical protein